MAKNKKVILFLQGPISPFFAEIADGLRDKGHHVLRINLNFGDWLFWPHGNAINFRKSLAAWPGFIRNFLNEHSVTDIILLGEQRDYHKIAIAEANSLNIQVTATDFGYIRPDWVTLEKNGLGGASNFPKDPSAIKKLAQLSPELDTRIRFIDSFPRHATWDILYHLSSSLFRILYPGYKSHHLHHPLWVYLGTGLRLLRANKDNRTAKEAIRKIQDKKTPFFLFPLQMATDFSIRAYSPYPHLLDAVEEVFESFAQHAPKNCLLVVKLHPLDPGIQNWEKIARKTAASHGIDDRLIFLHSGNLATLLDNSLGVVTVNSTVGLWALSAGVPLKALGQAIYDVTGLVHKGTLDSFWKEPTDPDGSLCHDFLRAIAGTLQVRGVFYNRPGLDNAVAQAIIRLDQDLINQPVDFTKLQTPVNDQP